MSFREEFPDFKDMPPIPSGWEDTSWHNDTCPSFYVPEAHLRLFVDYLNPEDRECPQFTRFILDRVGADYEYGDTGIVILETNDWDEVLGMVKQEAI